jgi:Mg-chelatase subunit ChlD
MYKDGSNSKELRKRIAPLILALVLAVSIVFPGMAPASATGGTGQFDLDVIFVIDNSSSMNQADPDKLALTAANLFIDMCQGSDSRAGYVMYTHRINAQRDLTDLISFSTDIKREIAGMAYSGWTDIALGLQTALDMFARAYSTAPGSHNRPIKRGT